MKYVSLIAAIVGGLAGSALADQVPVHECDKLAADPEDEHKAADGVSWENLVATAAIEACENAVRKFPETDRFQYQLALALAKSEQYEAALALLNPIADEGYRTAQITMGTMYLKGAGVPKDSGIAAEWFLKTPTMVTEAVTRSRSSRGSNDPEEKYTSEDLLIQAYKWSYISAVLVQKEYADLVRKGAVKGSAEPSESDSHKFRQGYNARGIMIWLGIAMSSTDISMAERLAKEWLRKNHDD